MSARREPWLVLVGTDHRAAPLELRERVALTPPQAEEALVHLLARPAVAEACVLSTCNRTEVYVQPRGNGERAYRAALELVFLSKASELESQGRLYVKHDVEAARHLLAVASGLESMVLGEPEILGQVKKAAALAEALGASGALMRRLLRGAMAAGKRARRETAITCGAVSLGYAVVELERSIFTHPEQRRILLLGAGKTAALVARSLRERAPGHLTVANRAPARAREFRRAFPEAVAVPFAERLAAVEAADLVVASTAAGEAVLTLEQLARVMERRPSRPLLVVDLGVPRNVEPAAGRLENVFLHNLDSLDHLIQRNLKRRREAVPQVQEIVEQELEHFRGWHRGREAEPVIAGLQKQAEAIRRRVLADARGRFPPETHDALDRLTRSLVRKILHHPSSRLRGGAGEQPMPHLELVRELFQLETPGEDEDP